MWKMSGKLVKQQINRPAHGKGFKYCYDGVRESIPFSEDCHPNVWKVNKHKSKPVYYALSVYDCRARDYTYSIDGFLIDILELDVP